MSEPVDLESLRHRLLTEAARLWVAEHPPDRSQPYSTMRNEFLWAAEDGYFDAIGGKW